MAAARNGIGPLILTLSCAAEMASQSFRKAGASLLISVA